MLLIYFPLASIYMVPSTTPLHCCTPILHPIIHYFPSLNCCSTLRHTTNLFCYTKVSLKIGIKQHGCSKRLNNDNQENVPITLNSWSHNYTLSIVCLQCLYFKVQLHVHKVWHMNVSWILAIVMVACHSPSLQCTIF